MAGAPQEVVVAPSRSRVMPWVLVAVGIAIWIAAFALREDLRRESVTIRDRPAGKTVVEKAPGDAFLAGLVGAGLIAVLAGAFYTRVTKVTVFGNTLELGAPADSDALAAAVAAKVVEEQRASGTPLDAAAADAVSRSAVAAARAQSEALLVQAAVSAARPRATAAGAALPPDLIDRLVEHALAERHGPEDG
ncbi:MAG TPA: hypothetical protein VF587_00240 [Solirubrobacteraceae bacterium]